MLCVATLASLDIPLKTTSRGKRARRNVLFNDF